MSLSKALRSLVIGTEFTPTWHSEANCLGADQDLFFPAKGGYGGEKYREVREICDPCPVRGECLDHAVDFPELFGIWAGTTDRERRAIRRRRLQEAS